MAKAAPQQSTIWVDFEVEDGAGCVCSFIKCSSGVISGAEIELEYGEGTAVVREILRQERAGLDPVIKVEQEPEETFEIRFVDRVQGTYGDWHTRIWLDGV